MSTMKVIVSRAWIGIAVSTSAGEVVSVPVHSGAA
jgi:hypothetical protein